MLVDICVKYCYILWTDLLIIAKNPFCEVTMALTYGYLLSYQFILRFQVERFTAHEWRCMSSPDVMLCLLSTLMPLWRLLIHAILEILPLMGNAYTPRPFITSHPILDNNGPAHKAANILSGHTHLSLSFFLPRSGRRSSSDHQIM